MNMKNRLLALTLVLFLSVPAQAASRIKDIGHFAGVRSNSLVGYGLVIGLNKTGDKKQTVFTQQTLVNMLEQFGPLALPRLWSGVLAYGDSANVVKPVGRSAN
jgi:flagellar P-ring protein precursor FlgI